MLASSVRHLDLSCARTDPVELRPDQLLIFWWGERPIGQFEPPAGTGGLLTRAEMANRFVDPEILRAAMIEAQKEADPHMSGLRTTIVICTRDRPDELARCLASLRYQTRAPDQVVVVDNASSDERTRLVAEASGVTYVREDRAGLDIARNSGAQAASGDIIAYTDDDVSLHPGWLAALVAAFDRPDVMAVTGLVLPAELDTEAQRHFETYWSFGRGYRRIDFGPEFFATDRHFGCPAWEIGAGANMAFRREVFTRIGLFDERLDVGAAGCSGDSEFWHRILSHGGLCRYEPWAVVYHFHRRDFAGLTRQIRAYMRGHAAALMVQFERSGNRGNLRRALVTTPLWFGRRFLYKLAGRAGERDLLLSAEIAGFIAGLFFYWRSPRPVRRCGIP